MPMIESPPAYRLLTYRTSLVGPDGLTSINTTPINQGALVLVAGVLYRLDRNSSAVVDGVTVVAPDEGPGRWMLASVGGAYLTVANLTELAALGVAAPSLVWVSTLQCYWHRNSASTATIDGITVVATVGGVGRWERLVYTTAPAFLSQATWYIDFYAGSDENSGQLGAPIKTSLELSRRWSVGKVAQSTTVYFAAGPLTTDRIGTLDLTATAASGVVITLEGQPVAELSTTVTAYTARVHSPGTPQGTLLEVAGIADWTNYVSTSPRLLFRPTATDSMCWVAMANPSGLGVQVAMVSIPVSSTGTTERALAVNDPLEVRRLPQFASNAANVNITSDATQVIKYLNITSLSVDGANFNVIGCITAWNTTAGNQPTRTLRGCKITSNIYESGSINFCYAANLGVGTRALLLNRSILTESGAAGKCVFNASIGTQSPQQIEITDLQCFARSASNDAIELNSNCSVKVTSALSGTGRYGLVYNGGYGPGSFTWASTSVPNIVAATNEIRVRNATADVALLAWATAKYRSDEQHGTATLAAGTATVAARNANVRPVSVSMNTPGGTPGYLSVPVATKTASQFVINSTSGTDTSTVDWHIPGNGDLISIGPIGGAQATTAPI